MQELWGCGGGCGGDWGEMRESFKTGWSNRRPAGQVRPESTLRAARLGPGQFWKILIFNVFFWITVKKNYKRKETFQNVSIIF